MKAALICLLFVVSCITVYAQSQNDYQSNSSSSTGLLDPSRFSIHHSISAGMISGSDSKLKTQSLYSTMLQYKLAEPLTMNLNFGLPLYSNYMSSQNLNIQNIQSLEYFKNMPWDASVSWKPNNSMQMIFSVAHITEQSYLQNYFFDSQFDLFGDPVKRLGR